MKIQKSKNKQQRIFISNQIYEQGREDMKQEILEEIKKLENTDTTWNTWKKLKQIIEKSGSSGE